MKLLIINGPNLNLLGSREEQIYGNRSFSDYLEELKAHFDCEIDYFQSNHEGEIIDQMQASDHNGIILNAGGFTHTSVAIRDCIAAIDVPVVEVHISNVAAREEFRHTSLISPVAVGCIIGLGLDGYRLAVEYYLNKR